MSLVLGRFWGFMTPEYIYQEMTWEEISAALQFVNRYEEPKVPQYKRYMTIGSWVACGVDNFRDHARAAIRRIKNGQNS